MISSDPVFLKGPGGEDGATIIQPPADTAYGSIGSYTFGYFDYPGGRLGNQWNTGQIYSGLPVVGLPNGNWRCMGVGPDQGDGDGADVLFVRVS